MKIAVVLLFSQIIPNIQCQDDSQSEHHSLFEEATNSETFVDRTDMLRKFISLPSGCHLVTAPPLFGKSTTMDMMKRFFEIITDQSGRNIKSASSKRFRLFSKPDLVISKDKSFIKEHLGQYPVIYISFHDVHGSSDDEIIDYMIQKVSRAFTRYMWLNVVHTTPRTVATPAYRFGGIIMEYLNKRVEITETTTPENVNDYLFDKVLDNEADKDQVLEAIKVLLRLLHKFFNKRVMIFIDAYDAPLAYAIQNSLYSNEVLFYTDYLLYAFCRWDQYVERGFINGVSNVLRCCKGASTMYLPYYGFDETHLFTYDYVLTVQQVDRLLQSKKIAKKQRLAVTRRYNGYKLTDELTPVYNPYDIIEYMKRATVDDYWAAANTVQVLKPNLKYLTVMDKLTDLLICRRISFKMNRRIRLDDFRPFLQLMEGDHTLKDEAQFDLYFTYFFEHGYFSRTSTPNLYQLPNDEMADKFQKDYLNFMSQTYGITLTDNKEIAEALRSIVNHDTTTTESKTKLANALNEITGEDRYRLDYFELQSIILSALYFNSKNRGDLYQLNEVKYIDMPYLFSMNRTILQIASDDGTKLLIIRVSFRNKLTTPEEKTRNYVPWVHQNKTKIVLIKYLAINTDWDDLAVVYSPRSRSSWVGGRIYKIPKPRTTKKEQMVGEPDSYEELKMKRNKNKRVPDKPRTIVPLGVHIPRFLR